MQRRLIALAAAAALPATAPAATRGFSVTSFDRIRLEAPFAVTLRTGAGPSARAEAVDARVLEGVRIEVMGRTLVIRRDRDGAARSAGVAGADGGRGVRIALTTPAVTGATVLGAGSLTVAAGRATRFDAGVSGAGTLGVTGLDVDQLAVTITGAGNATLAGRAAGVRALVQGAGTVAAADLAAQDVSVSAAGTSTVTLAAARTARVTAAGGGAITILGTPACTVASEGTVEVTCTGPARR